MFLRADFAICAKMSGGEIKSAIHPQPYNNSSLWTVKSTHVWSVWGLLRRFDEYWFSVYKLRRCSIMRHRRPFTVSSLLCSPKGPLLPPLVNMFSPNLMFSTFQIKPCIRLFLHRQLPTLPPAPGRYDSTRGTFSSEFSSQRKPAGGATGTGTARLLPKVADSALWDKGLRSFAETRECRRLLSSGRGKRKTCGLF